LKKWVPGLWGKKGTNLTGVKKDFFFAGTTGKEKGFLLTAFKRRKRGEKKKSQLRK